MPSSRVSTFPPLVAFVVSPRISMSPPKMLSAMRSPIRRPGTSSNASRKFFTPGCLSRRSGMAVVADGESIPAVPTREAVTTTSSNSVGGRFLFSASSSVAESVGSAPKAADATNRSAPCHDRPELALIATLPCRARRAHRIGAPATVPRVCYTFQAVCWG